MNISTRPSNPSKTVPSSTQARTEQKKPTQSVASSRSSQDKAPTQSPSSSQIGESSELSAESRETPDENSSVESLLEGLSGWANESTPSLQLGEGQLLSQGRSSEPQQVNQLQEMLNSRGHQLEVDGKFGPLTAEAVRSVQDELGVTVDGIVGPETMAALNSPNEGRGNERGSGDADTGTGGTNEFNPETLTPNAPGEQSSSPISGQRGLEGLPPRSQEALGGQAFMNSIQNLRPGEERNQAVLQEILSGNVPENSRALQNVTVQRNGREISMDVMPDYLAIGSNEDNVRIPMTPAVAQAIADRTGMSLPTDRIVDDIHAQARQLHLDPLGASSQMSSIGWYNDHDQRIDRQLGSGQAPTGLVSGHKKDLVIPARDGRVAIYGGRWQNGSRVQSYSNVHSDTYEDYSHGARLISQQVTVDGQTMTLADALADPSLRSLFTNQ